MDGQPPAVCQQAWPRSTFVWVPFEASDSITSFLCGDVESVRYKRDTEHTCTCVRTTCSVRKHARIQRSAHRVVVPKHGVRSASQMASRHNTSMCDTCDCSAMLPVFLCRAAIASSRPAKWDGVGAKGPVLTQGSGQMKCMLSPYLQSMVSCCVARCA